MARIRPGACAGSLVAVSLASPPFAMAVPPGFLEEVVVEDLDVPIGITFAADGRWFHWDQHGVVTTRRNEDEPGQTVIDLSDEVGLMANQGLLGLALDPDFLTNGRLYLFYAVDWEYHVTGGDPDPERMDRKQDTFARLTRYTCTWDQKLEEFTCGERIVLIGLSHETGVPLTSDSHGPGTLIFGEDGTLLASVGDGACYAGADTGGERNPVCSDNSAEQKGILQPKERVGAFRAQLIDSYSGKILRLDPGTIDPELGVAGVPSNPFFDPDDPYAPRSKVWALGVRNPYRITIRPGSGSLDPVDGNPGTIYVGDVGWRTWEEADIVRSGGANLGWPVFEGLEPEESYADTPVENLDAPNPLFDGKTCAMPFFRFTDLLVQETLNEPSFPNPCDADVTIESVPTFMHHRPEFDFRHGQGHTRVRAFDEDGNAIALSIYSRDSPIEGDAFDGRSSLGGAFTNGVHFPPEYRRAYFFGDTYGRGGGSLGWIRVLDVDPDGDRPYRIRRFRQPDDEFFPVHLTFDATGYGLYAVQHSFPGGPGSGNIRRITWDCNRNGVPDACDIETGESADENGNGIPDECECPDVDGSGAIDVGDIVQILAAWGPCPGCPADIDGSGVVDFADLLIVLGAWGPC